MNIRVALCTLLLVPSAVPVSADQVILISGEVLEGEIVAENAQGIEFETARTRSRSHRVVHFLDHQVVRSVSRSNPKPEILPELAPGSYVDASRNPAPVAYDLQSLKDAVQERDLLDQGQYDEAIEKYKQVTELAYEAAKVETNLTTKAEWLTLQQHSYDLWEVAIEGKVEALDEKEKRLEELVESELKQAEDQLDALRDRVDDAPRSDRPAIRLGSGRTPTRPVSPAEKALIARVDAAQNKLAQFNAWKKGNGDAIKALEAEAALIKEKGKQIKTELALVNREVKNQERLRR